MKKIDLAQRVRFIKLFTDYNWDVRPSGMIKSKSL